MSRRQTYNDHLIPDRRWTATVTRADGTMITTTIYGRNADEAETRYLASNPDVTRVIVRSVQSA